MNEIIKEIESLNVLELCTDETAEQIRDIKRYLKDNNKDSSLLEYYIYALGYIKGSKQH